MFDYLFVIYLWSTFRSLVTTQKKQSDTGVISVNRGSPIIPSKSSNRNRKPDTEIITHREKRLHGIFKVEAKADRTKYSTFHVWQVRSMWISFIIAPNQFSRPYEHSQRPSYITIIYNN